VFSGWSVAGRLLATPQGVNAGVFTLAVLFFCPRITGVTVVGSFLITLLWHRIKEMATLSRISVL
jgi:hypothetical protein